MGIERLPDGSTWWVPSGFSGGEKLPEAQIGPFAKQTGERCPGCFGIGRVEGPLRLDAYDIWDCPKCDGKGFLESKPSTVEGEE